MRASYGCDRLISRWRGFGGVALAASLAASGACQGRAPLESIASFGVIEAVGLFGANGISTAAPEFAITLTPDLRTAYFDRANADRSWFGIMESHYENGLWLAADTVPFSGTYRDADPFITPDGARLYFSSNRPTRAGDAALDFNTWYVERAGTGWSEARQVGAPVDTDSSEVFVSADREGTLYYASNRDGVHRVYRSRLRRGRFQAPELVDFDMNRTRTGAGNPAISPDGRMLVIATADAGGHGGPDLFVTCQRAGMWSSATNAGGRINSSFADFAPAFSADGAYFFFTSERPGIVGRRPEGERPPGDIYYISASHLSASCPAS